MLCLCWCFINQRQKLCYIKNCTSRRCQTSIWTILRCKLRWRSRTRLLSLFTTNTPDRTNQKRCRYQWSKWISRRTDVGSQSISCLLFRLCLLSFRMALWYLSSRSSINGHWLYWSKHLSCKYNIKSWQLCYCRFK